MCTGFRGRVGLCVQVSAIIVTNLSCGSNPIVLVSKLPGKDSEGNEYTCDSELDLSYIFELFSSWIEATEYNIFAAVAIVVLNLHEDKANPPTEGSDAPVAISSLPDLPGTIYSPNNLASDRSDLNYTWLHGGAEGDDEARYFEVQRKPEGGLWSVNAWPSESYLAFETKERLLLAFGDVNVAGFDPSKDGGLIFQPDAIEWPYPSQNAPCLFNPSTTSVKDTSNTWAHIIDSSGDEVTPETFLSYIDCGYSLIINTTITDPSSSIYPQIGYLNLLKGLIWSWAPGEPAPPSSNMSETEADLFRCASMNATTGRWKVTDCNAVFYAACRVEDKPYTWVLSTRTARYFDAGYFCPQHSSFDIPRAALENQYLLHAINSTLPPGEDQIWIDYQSLAVQGCWTSGGGDAQCPYEPTDASDMSIIVPTVAAIIVLVIAALVVFAKLGNRRMEKVRKRRRRIARKAGEFAYEGVPAS